MPPDGVIRLRLAALLIDNEKFAKPGSAPEAFCGRSKAQVAEK